MAKKINEVVKSKSNVDSDIKKLKLLVTVVDRSKALFYTDLLEQYEVNMQLVCYGRGTADSEMLRFLGLASSEKAVILSIIKEELTSEILSTLSEKFERVKNGKGISYTIPLKSMIGVSIYQFLSNEQSFVKEDKSYE